LEFKGRAAAGKPGEVGYQAAEGAVWYYLYDVEKKQKIANWLMGFNMMEGPPPSGPYPMTGLVITGNTARFEAFNMKWTVIDGGEGHNKDRVTIDDGVRQKDMRLYGGDLKVVSFPTQPSKKDEGCVRCHDGPAKDMFAKGGKHKELGCKRCHVGHPPAVKKPITPCVKCHQPHTSAMTAASCGSCHKAHTASVVNYVFNVSPQDCAACHKKASDDLYASKSKHAKLGCALCHPGKHKTVSSCLDCHGAPHPSHVMKNKEVCGNCHNTAHKTDSARLKK
jgi:predicted CXXCH cytochrome family protein